MKSRYIKILFVLIPVAFGLPTFTSAQNYTPYAVTTLNSLGGAQSGTTFFAPRPYDIAIKGNSNVFVVCYQQYTIYRMWTTNGTNWSQELYAGVPNSNGANDGFRTGARFTYPNSLVTDSHGNLFVSDSGNYLLRKITPDGTVTTVAGRAGLSAYVDGVGTNAQFRSIGGMGIDANDNIYYPDYGANRLRKITPGGVVSTVAAPTTIYAEFGGSVCVGPDGNIYHASSTLHTIRRFTPGGAVTTIAGLQLSSGSIDGTNSSARFNVPNDIAADAFGNLYVAEGQSAIIRKITPIGNDWVVTTIAGSPGLRGNNNGTGSAARFTVPAGITIDSEGKLYISDNDNGLNTGATVRLAVPNGANRWTNSSNGKWEEATTKWSAGVPSLLNTANYITNAASKIVLVDANTVASNSASLTINNLKVSAPNGSTNSFILLNSGASNPLRIHERLVIDSGGLVALTNSSIIADYGVAVGVTNGNAFFNLVNGGTLTAQYGYVGLDDAGLNGALISGIGSIWNNTKTFTLGYYSANTNGVFVQQGGSIISGEMSSIGEGCDGNLLAVTGAGSTFQNTGGLRIGWESGNNNSLVIENNGVVNVGAGGLDIGDGGDNNSVSVIGSTLTSAGPIRLVGGGGPEGNALLIGVGGKVVTPSLVVSNGSYAALNAGTLETGGMIVDNSLPFYVGLATDPATLKLTGGTHSFALGLGITTGASLTGCGNIDSYLTVIDTGGTVNLDSSCQLNFSGNVTNRGTLNGDGTLFVRTNYTQTSGGTLHVDLGGPVLGTYGRLNVGNTAELAGSLVLTISFTPTTNDTFTIVNAASCTGTFANFIYPSNLVGMTISYTPTSAVIRVTHAPITITNAPGITNGEFAADFAGQPGTTYTIEYTESLYPANWLTFTNAVASPSGNVSVRDLPLQPSRYYRARYVTE